MIRHAAVKPEAAEPAIRQVKVDLLAQAPLGADAEAVSDDEHPDHQFGIDRWPPHRAVEGGQLPPQVVKLHEPVDGAQQMVSWNVPFERELVEQSNLVDLPMSHHDLQPCAWQRLNQRMSCVATTDFFNTIGQKQTLSRGSVMSAITPKADMGRRIHVGIWLPVYESARLVNSLVQLLDSLAKVSNERLQSHMQMITLMLSAVIIYPCHQFFRAFSFRHVGPLRR